MTQSDEDFVRGLFVEAGVDPDDLYQVLDQASVGLTLMLWRNSPIEDWHAGSTNAFSDADMLRLNSHTTMHIRRRLYAWCRDMEVSSMDDLDEIDPADLENFVDPLYEWLIRPTRQLVIGGTLINAAERALAAYHRESPEDTPADLTSAAIIDDYALHVDKYGSGWINRAEKVGVPSALLAVGRFMGSLTTTWWGTRRWPESVDALFRILDQPDHEYWQRAEPPGVPTPPPAVPDRSTLRVVLLTEPWRLNDQSANWLVNDVGMAYAIHHGRAMAGDSSST